MSDTNPAKAKIEATKTPESLKSMDKANRMQQAQFIRDRGESFTSRTASNVQLALPKTRVPGQSLIDKGIPHNVADPKELEQIWGWCRHWYSTHDLIPLLVDIYSHFPLIGLELTNKDNKIQEFYEDMFFNELNYEEFMPDALGREYFTVGEVTTLAHFNESLGIWSSEEVLDPNQLLITKSMFVGRERVQLLVKDMVEMLRDGPKDISSKETPSQERERRSQYEDIQKFYPEFIEAAAKEDGIDLSDALVSRLVNRAFHNDLRGTPHMMRSFRTLMMEESIHAAQDAVADRMYSPLILAKLGLPSLGDGDPWIPGQDDLDAVRDDLQAALSADFKLMVGNVGLDITSVFGREILPRFNDDYDRIDAKLLQAWGIGQALIAGGNSQGGNYASSALNREFASQLMSAFQKKVTKHILKRAEVIAEAQEHYDYELKGGIRRPIYRDIVRTHEDGTEEIVRVPKLLLPEPKWTTMNLRDEAQERQFLQALKGIGVPVSDRALSTNTDLILDEQLELQADETVKKQMAQVQAMDKVKRLCDEQGVAYSGELVNFLNQTLALRGQLAQTEMMEIQEKQLDQQYKQSTPAGAMGLLPGTQAQPGVPSPDNPTGALPPEAAGPQAGPPDAGGAPPQGQAAGTPAQPSGGGQEQARNRQRPSTSDDQRAAMPKAASKLSKGPSSYGKSQEVGKDRVAQAVRRREAVAKAKYDGQVKVGTLINDPDFYVALNLQAHEANIRKEFADMRSGTRKESSLVDDAITQYQETFGIDPVW